MPLVWKCVDLVRPDVKHDGDYMDIRKYIKIKKLPCKKSNLNKKKIHTPLSPNLSPNPNLTVTEPYSTVPVLDHTKVEVRSNRV